MMRFLFIGLIFICVMTTIRKKKVSAEKKVARASIKKVIPIAPTPPVEFIPLALPSNNNSLAKYISTNRIKLMETVISSVENAMQNNMHVAEVFTFDNNDFLITVNRAQFKKNIEKIYNFYVQNEYFELCPRVVRLIKSLNEK